MFYYISGNLVLLEPGVAAIDAGGVAYRMSISHTTYDALPKNHKEQRATLYTYLSVREDSLELYGFASVEELSAFRMLITVSGVGPKVALSLLSVLSPEKFALAVLSEDRKAISQAPGIGPKTAARIILELRDKLASKQLASGSGEQTPGTAAGHSSNTNDAVEALMVLGYSRTEALRALKDVDIVTLPLEEIIRLALKKLIK
ncbi:MAG TPA: Holliday junction branch migration protein RuvA [Clostridiales bacterium]|jgi:Holliday junction DNA helicase RuvA|nr:Holliday junction branch migration protein RuvA [Clostridiales bacterium]